jgi:adenosylhomocysteinase
MRAKAFGAKVIVTEVDPVKAIEARMDGHDVMPIMEAAKYGDFFVTVTGCKKAIPYEAMLNMKNGAILANAGHFDLEVDMAGLKEHAVSSREARNNIMAYKLPNGKEVNVIAEGRLCNIAAADGHPAEIMDLSFAVQAYSAMYIKDHHGKLDNKLIHVGKEIDEKIARLKLDSWGIQIDELTEEQKEYLGSWNIEEV